MSQVAQETLTAEPVGDERVVPFLSPAKPDIDTHVAIVGRMQQDRLLPPVFPPFHERQEWLKPLPKVLVVGTDESALEAGERLMNAGCAVVFAEEDSRPRSLAALGQKRAEWGLGVLSNPQAIVLTNCRLSGAEIAGAGFSGVVLSHEIEKDTVHTEVDMSLPLVVPARSLLYPGLKALDLDRKIPNPDDIRGGKRFGRLHGGQMGRIGVYGYDPLEAVAAAQKVALMHVADAAQRKHRIGLDRLAHDALVSSDVRHAAGRLGLAPGDVGTTTLILPREGDLDDVGVSEELLERNHITVLHHADVLSVAASPSPDIVHVNLRHRVSELNVVDRVVGFSGLVVADGTRVDYDTNSLTVPVLRVGLAAGSVDDMRDEAATAQFAHAVKTQGVNNHEQVFQFVDHKTTGDAQRMNYVADWLISEMPIFWNGHVPQKLLEEESVTKISTSQDEHKQPEVRKKPDMKELVGHEIPPHVLPFLADPEERRSHWMSIHEAAREFWARYGKPYKDVPVKSFEDWVAAKRDFHSESGHVEIAIFGGGAGAYIAALQIRARYKNAHVVIFEKEGHMGGMALSAISPFVDNHEETKISAARTAMQAMMDPGVDVITGFEVADKDIPWMAKNFGFKVMIDARGAEPNRLKQLPYDGEQIMTVTDFLGKVNVPYDRDGHFGQVHLPATYTQGGPAHRGFIVGGGLAGLDVLVATELVRTVDDIERKWGIPRHLINVEALLSGGLLQNRTADPQPKSGDPGLGFRYLAHGETTVLYHGNLGDVRMEKLLKGANGLTRGDRELRKMMLAELARRQKMYGGVFVGYSAIRSVRREPDGSLLLTIEDPRNHGTHYASASFIASAIGFTRRYPIPDSIITAADKSQTPVPGTVVIGIGKSGAGDLSATGATIRDVMPQVEAVMKSARPSDASQARMFVQMIVSHQVSKGQRWTNEDPVDPIVHFMQHAPEALIAKGFRTRAEEEVVVPSVEKVQSQPAVRLSSTVEVPRERNELLDILARAHERQRMERAELFNRVAELGLPVDRRSGIVLPEVPPVEAPIGSLDELRDAVTTRRQIQAKAMVLAHLRDPLVIQAKEGGYNDPKDVGLPDADTLNILMNLTEEDIVLRHYYTGGKDRVNKNDEEWHTADYISIRIHDKRRGIDEERDLRIRMLRNGDFQYQRGGRWYTVRSVNSLRQALGRPFGAHTAAYEHDGYAYMDMFRDRLAHERGRAGLIYVLGQLERLGVKDKTTVDQFTFLVRQLIVSPEGNLFLRRYESKTREETLEWLLTNAKTRKAISRLLTTQETMLSLREQMKEDALEFITRYQYAASLTLGLFAKAGLTHLMRDPDSLTSLVGLGVGWGLLMNRLMARVKHGYLVGSVDHTMVQLMERITGHVAAFGMGVLLSEPTHALFERFTEHADASGVSVTHEPTATLDAPGGQTVTQPHSDGSGVPVQPDAGVAGTPLPSDATPQSVTPSQPAFDASIYHGDWQTHMVEMVNKLGGTQGWMNTIDNNGVSQAEVMTHWQILLDGRIPSEDLSRILDQIAQTKDFFEYMNLRETLLRDLQVLLAQ